MVGRAVADGRVLIIEDESDVAATTALVLRGAGYTVDVALGRGSTHINTRW
jgi:DNA-binding response OmpR family regulator